MKRQHNKVDRLGESREDTIARSAAELRDVDAWIEHSKQQDVLIHDLYLALSATGVKTNAFSARQMTLLMNKPGALGQAMERRNY